MVRIRLPTGASCLLSSRLTVCAPAARSVRSSSGNRRGGSGPIWIRHGDETSATGAGAGASRICRSIAVEHQSNVAHATVLGIRLDLKAQFPAHFQHDGIFLKNLAFDAAKALGLCVLDDQLHQSPA